MKPVLYVLREEKHLVALNAFLEANWRSAASQGHPWAIQITPEKAKRSVEANRYHWQLMNYIAEHAWMNGRQFSAETWHRYFCGEFLGKEEMPDGSMTYISSTTLSVSEFAEFDRKIEAYAGQVLGLTLLEVA